jgi:orotidine-5'-phosphate decarboxylase
MPLENRLIVAIDTANAARAFKLAQEVGPHCGMVKLGLEFFAANGPLGARAFRSWPIFLDLKLHDIPNTVAGAIRAVLPLRPRMLTVHAMGGPAMIAAAREACGHGEDRPLLLAVTVLTSLRDVDLTMMGSLGSVQEQVVWLGGMAMEHGADGLVCSPIDVSASRKALGNDPILVAPGVRPYGSDPEDQVRVMTPEEAVASGADFIVVGRPITRAPSPSAAAQAIAAAL